MISIGTTDRRAQIASMMRRVVLLYFTMLVLVVAQAHQNKESSSSIGQAPIDDSVTSTPGDEGKTHLASDCGKMCLASCSLFKHHNPNHYALCLYYCKKHCNDQYGPLSDAIYTCTFACADSMPSTRPPESGKYKFMETIEESTQYTYRILHILIEKILA